MIPPTKRQQQIMDCSIKIIAENGLESLTTKNISKSVGFSEAAIYKHFKSKNRILISILDYFERETQNILDEVQHQKKSSLEIIYEIFSARINQFMNSPALVIIIFSEEIFGNTPELAEKVFQIMELNQKVLSRIFSDGQLKGEIRTDADTRQLFMLVVGSFRFIVLGWKLAKYNYNLMDDFKKNWEFITKLIKK